MSVKSQVAKVFSKVYPTWDERPWNSLRDTELNRVGLERRPEKSVVEHVGDSHVVVIPIEGPSMNVFEPGRANIYYEAFATAVERYGTDNVSLFDVAPGEDSVVWQGRLRDYLGDVHASHVLFHCESDPGGAADDWNWDAMIARTQDSFNGVYVGGMFDSSHKWISAKSRRLARMTPRFMVVDICVPHDGTMVRGRAEVGPVNMPMSSASLELLHSRIDSLPKTHDVSFIGALYPYRVALIEMLRAEGLNVAVNPHRAEATKNLLESRADQPGWLDYMAGLAQSKMTINFSQSSAGPFQQLKTRVLEATLAGTYLLTDDRDRTREFFEPGVEFGFFPTTEDLPKLAPDFIRAAETFDWRSVQEKAEYLGRTDYWSGIESGLAVRGLTSLPEPLTS